MAFSQSLPRDANFVPVSNMGFQAVTSQTLSGSNTTVATPLFRLTGTVLILGMYGIVTTDLGSNHTAAHYRINDQTAQVALTLATGTTLSSLKAGSMIIKKGLVGAAITAVTNAAGAISEPTTLQTSIFTPVSITKKTAAVTDIEYVYTTSSTPTSGVIQHYVYYFPLSSDGALSVI